MNKMVGKISLSEIKIRGLNDISSGTKNIIIPLTNVVKKFQ